MKSFLNIIKLDYLQRTRSYAFLVTLCVSLALAYSFVPDPESTYTTVRIGDYIGNYNAAWIGYVTAIMASSFVSLLGFYLVNGSIATDINTKVGQIVASTQVGNFKYLFSKVLSNFLVLLSIAMLIFAMSILLFFWYGKGYTFDLMSFVKPYVIITFPTLFLISILAVVSEVFLGRYSIIQNIGFFFLFGFMAFSMQDNNTFNLDITGSKIVMQQMENQVQEIVPSETVISAIGYTKNNNQTVKRFDFMGINFPVSFLLSRVVWLLFGMAILGLSSLFFHRFNTKEKKTKEKNKLKVSEQKSMREVVLSSLPKAIINFGMLPLLKTELLLLFRSGKKWLWLLNLGGMLLLAFLDLKTAYQFVLPILWFLQVSRLSNLTTKEITHNVYYLAYASYKPLGRLLVSQLGAGIILMLFLALPLLVRLLTISNFTAVLSIALGGVFIVLFAATLGILAKGKKLFEILFFMMTYAIINGISFFDYFGGLTEQPYYIFRLFSAILVLGLVSFMVRKVDLRNV